MATTDLEVIKDIPGYKVILKAVLKTQIQQLVEQLAANTDEESLILTASVVDGTLCHLGSESGKGFLEEQEDVKTHFLGFCLKKHHEKMQAAKEAEKNKERQKALAAQVPLPRQFDIRSGQRQHQCLPFHTSPRQSFSPKGGFNIQSPRHKPYQIPRPNRRVSSTDLHQGPFPSENIAVKTELRDEESQNGSELNTKDEDNTNSSFSEQSEIRAGENTNDNLEIEPKSIKIEAISDHDFELEITGIEPGQPAMAMPGQNNWDPNVSVGMNFDPSTGFSAADASGLQMSDCEEYPHTTWHQGEVHVPLRYFCKVCGKGFTKYHGLWQHKFVHSDVKEFACDICGKAFKLKCNLSKHKIIHFNKERNGIF